jgi:hypothetical protein
MLKTNLLKNKIEYYKSGYQDNIKSYDLQTDFQKNKD